MRKVDDATKGKKECRFQWPLPHCQQSTAKTTTAGTHHARAKCELSTNKNVPLRNFQSFLVSGADFFHNQQNMHEIYQKLSASSKVILATL